MTDHSTSSCTSRTTSNRIGLFRTAACSRNSRKQDLLMRTTVLLSVWKWPYFWVRFFLWPEGFCLRMGQWTRPWRACMKCRMGYEWDKWVSSEGVLSDGAMLYYNLEWVSARSCPVSATLFVLTTSAGLWTRHVMNSRCLGVCVCVCVCVRVCVSACLMGT